MRLRLYSVIAIIIAMFLLPVAGRGQEPAAKPEQQSTPPAGQEANPPAAQESMPQAPVEPVMSGAYPVMSQAAEDRARQIFEMFNHGESGQMWASLSDGLRRVSGKEERFTKINKAYHDRMGMETEMLEENIVPYLFAPDTVYSRLSYFAAVHTPVMIAITINQRGLIDAFDIKVMPSISEGKYAGYQDTAKLRLPFDGEWLVYQGGRNAFDNPYAISDDQRFAMDFAYLKNGRLFSGAGGFGSRNQDYYCFGQPILAPADGTVIRAEAGYDDNPPGKASGDPADGNLIVILHEEGEEHESSMINHLKQNSLTVKRGDKVKQGQVIAECGNSGAGTVPHLHYQLQRTAGVPLPAQFVNYIADGKPVASGEPKRGQFVKNGEPTATTTIGTTSGKAKLLVTTPAGGSGNTAPPAEKPGH